MTQQPPAYTQPIDYAQPPAPKKKHTVRNVLLILLLVFILFAGGCFALVGAGLKAADDAIKANDSRPGGADNPLAITEGKAFEVDGFEYAAGWKVSGNPFGVEIKKLKVTNNRDDKDSAIVEVKFMKGSEVLALVDCSTEPITVGQTTTLSCVSTDKLPKKYDEITINDTF